MCYIREFDGQGHNDRLRPFPAPYFDPTYKDGGGGKVYPAYCAYIPTGMDEDFEKPILDKLKKWGETMGANLYVAPWDLGDPSYIQLMNKIGFKHIPAIILSDKDVASLDKNSFMLILDDPRLIRDVPKLSEVLPALLALILKEEHTEAAKAAIKARKISMLKIISKDLESVLNKVKITFDGNAIGVQAK